ncbi:amidohydrolase [Canibacter zhoujuaniae]|uniref:amidohydrolase n=1 Tax=Canibacter zhoujuaniae TaxID=2708343 RepID=UPI001FB9CC4C|nr:amidohydrolase [Canibacter zhoujuaniae]
MTTVLYADALVTAGKTVLDAELRFANGRITAVGAKGSLGALPAGAKVRDLRGRILIPGLTNGHTHSAMTLLRGVSDDHGFMPWLAEVQALEQHLTEEDVLAGLQLAMLEMIASGTTAFADMYVWNSRLIQAVSDAGMRVVAAPATVAPDVVMFPGVTARDGAAELAHTAQLAEEFHGDPLIKIAFGPHAPYSVPREFFVETIAHAKESGLPIHTHISESPAEVAQMLDRVGKTPGDYLRDLGLLDAKVLAAHCVHLTAGEIGDYVAAGAALSHNPVSNLKLGNGVADFPEWLASGAQVSLGTDSVASNNNLDLFEEMKLAAMLHRGVRHDAAAVTAESVFEVATKRGAKAIGFAGSGELAVGKCADIVALNVTGVNAIPHDNLVSHIVFAAGGHDVTDVWVNGRALYKDGEHLTLDAQNIKQRARVSAARIRAAAAEKA